MNKIVRGVVPILLGVSAHFGGNEITTIVALGWLTGFGIGYLIFE